MPDTNDYYFKSKSADGKSEKKLSLRRPVAFFLVILSVILVMSVFFKISKINVQGNSIYSDEDIITASGIQEGDNLFFFNRIAAGSRVVVKLPYVDAVKIIRGLPNRITIQVQESNAIAYVNVNGELWSVSATGKFLGTVKPSDAEYMAKISGITVTEATVGDSIKGADDEEGKCAYLIEIMEQIQSRGMITSVSSIDLSVESDPVIEYDDRFTVKLGEKDNTEYKFGKLVAAVARLGASDAGTLDVSEGTEVQFSPN